MVDANVLIAALMRDSTSRYLLILSGHELHVPMYVFEEIEGHWEELSSRSGLSPDALREVLRVLRAHVTEHRESEYADRLDEALGLLKGRDPKDAPYVALALALAAEGLWSEDRGLVSTGSVQVFRTTDLVRRAP